MAFSYLLSFHLFLPQFHFRCFSFCKQESVASLCFVNENKLGGPQVVLVQRHLMNTRERQTGKEHSGMYCMCAEGQDLLKRSGKQYILYHLLYIIALILLKLSLTVFCPCPFHRSLTGDLNATASTGHHILDKMCFRPCGNSLGSNPSCFNITMPHCAKPGPPRNLCSHVGVGEIACTNP